MLLEGIFPGEQSFCIIPSVSSSPLTSIRQLIQSVVLAGYRYLREVDKSLCISFCMQDPNCTAVTYSVHKPPHASSLCKFYSTVNNNRNVHLNLTKRNGSDGTQSDLVLIISKLCMCIWLTLNWRETPTFQKAWIRAVVTQPVLKIVFVMPSASHLMGPAPCIQRGISQLLL